jgi:hypothetical protein
MILRNHGLLTVGETPAQAFLRMYYLDKACEIQTAATAAGAGLVIPGPDICELTARQLAGEDDQFGPPGRQGVRPRMVGTAPPGRAHRPRLQGLRERSIPDASSDGGRGGLRVSPAVGF